MADKVEIEVVPTYTAAAVEATKSFFSSAFGSAMKSIPGAGIVGQGFQEAKAVGGLAASGAGAAMSAVTGPIGALGAVADLISKFTNAINPAIMEQFSMAMNDIFAVVGQALTPAFEILTPAIQMMGDFLASILPNTESLFQELMPALDTIRNALATIAPLLNEGLVFALELLVKVTNVLVEAFRTASKAFAEIMIALLDYVPDFVPGMKDLQDGLKKFVASLEGGPAVQFQRTSRGAAGQGASFVGLGELTRGAIASGFGQGRGAQEQTAENTKKIADVVDKEFGGGNWRIRPRDAEGARGGFPE
jgi:hypothetical protein